MPHLEFRWLFIVSFWTRDFESYLECEYGCFVTSGPTDEKVYKKVSISDCISRRSVKFKRLDA